MKESGLKDACHCNYCLWEGTFEELEVKDSDPVCPICKSLEITDGPIMASIQYSILQDLYDWLVTPQSTGGRFPMETNRAEAEDLDHVLVSVRRAIEEREL